MINQKALSLKLDVSVLEELDKEVQVTWKSRNRIINDAVRLYLDTLDTQRRARAHGVGSPECDKAVTAFLKTWILPEANYYIGQITI